MSDLVERLPVRVLLIPDRFPPQRGGVAVSARRNARLLAPFLERLDVVHLTGDLPRGAAESRLEDGYTVHSLGRAAREEDSLQLLELAATGLARETGAGIVHGFYALPAGYVATLVARCLGLRSVVSLRGNDADRGVFSHPGMLHWTLAQADRILAVSRAIARRVETFAGQRDTVFTPNSVDPGLFRPGPPATDLGPDPVVLFAGEMRFKKGLDPFLAAVSELAAEPVSFVLAGGVRREERGVLETWSRRNPAARLLELPYARDPERLAALYNRADLVVLPALFEGMPNALLEAMACARPVLATAVGGVPDLVEDGRSGWLMPVEDLHRLGGRIRAALASPPEVRAALGQAARERVQASFRPEDERDRLLAVYHELAVSELAGLVPVGLPG